MLTPHQFLKKIFFDLKMKNKAYSLRAFAKKLGTSPGALSDILNGKRTLSHKSILQFSKNLALSPIEADQFTRTLSVQSKKSLETVQLHEDQFNMISDWIHYGILNLVQSKQCIHRIDWFANRLLVSEKKVQESIDRLLRLGFIKIVSGKYVRTVSPLKTPDDVASASVVKSNVSDLEMIQNAYITVPRDQRDSISTTMLIDRKKMKKIKEYLRSIQDDFAEHFEDSASADVYRLSFHLFPLKNHKDTI